MLEITFEKIDEYFFTETNHQNNEMILIIKNEYEINKKKLEQIIKNYFTAGQVSVRFFHQCYNNSTLYKLMIQTENSENKYILIRLLNLNIPINNRKNEILASIEFGQKNIGPVVLHSNVEHEADFYLYEYLQGNTIQKFDNEQLLKETANKLQKLHNSKFYSLIKHSPKIKYMKMIQIFNQGSELKPTLFNNIAQYLYAIDRFISELKDFQPCHNDLHQSNIFQTGDDVKLIDFEFASVGNIYYDLCFFIFSYALNNSQEKYFLKSYFGGKHSKYHEAKVFFNKKIIFMIEATHNFMDAKLKCKKEYKEFYDTKQLDSIFDNYNFINFKGYNRNDKNTTIKQLQLQAIAYLKLVFDNLCKPQAYEFLRIIKVTRLNASDKIIGTFKYNRLLNASYFKAHTLYFIDFLPLEYIRNLNIHSKQIPTKIDYQDEKLENEEESAEEFLSIYSKNNQNNKNQTNQNLPQNQQKNDEKQHFFN